MRKFIACLTAAFLAAALPHVGAAAEVSVDFFYTSLEPYGEWVEAADYGYVWHPRDAAEDWRPYTEGSWAYTDAGWTWVSDEPFGAITYHYGRWAQLADVGWAWVPDTEWAPAWVSWRRSEKLVGWAPLPPEARFQRTVGIKTWSDSYYDVGPANYTFVEVRHLGAPKIRAVILPPRENVTIIRETRNITNITIENNYVYVGGPEYDVVVRESAEPIRRLRIERRTDVAFDTDRGRGDNIRSQIQGDTLRVVAPVVAFTPEARPARVARHIERVEVNRGWRDAGPQAEQLRAVISQQAPKPPAELPAKPRFQPVRERVAENTRDQDRAGQAAGAVTPGAAGGRDRDRMRERGGSGAPTGVASDASPTTTTPGSATARSDKPAASTERPLAPDGSRRPGDPTATAPGAPDRPDAPSNAGNRRNRNGQRPGASTDPAANAEKNDKPATTPTTEATPGEKTPTEPPKPTRVGGAVRERKVPAPTDPAIAPTPDSPTPGADKPERKERPERSGRGGVTTPGARNNPEQPVPGAANDNPDRPSRPDRAATAERPAGTERSNRPEAGERPARPERADAPERGPRPERPERPAAPAESRGGAEREGANRGPRPEGANSAGAERRGAARSEAPAGAGARTSEGKRGGAEREVKKGAAEERAGAQGQ